MINARFTSSVLLSALIIALSAPAAAQQVDISECRGIEDRLDRFDCYENLGTAESSANVPPAPASTPPAVTRPVVANPQNLPVIRRPVNNTLTQSADPSEPAAESTPQETASSDVDQFGKKPGATGASSADVITRDDGKTELVDTIASLTERRQNLWLITLESGQRWLQMESKRYALQEGDTVRIYPTIWGSSYRLTAARLEGYIQVERVD